MSCLGKNIKKGKKKGGNCVGKRRKNKRQRGN
jgi:hypothetical protein